jgi:addiction module RelE/StbE family toxin
MLKVLFSKKFSKMFERLPNDIKEKAKNKMHLFNENRWNPILKIHPLQGEYSGTKSMNVTGDYRIIFKYLSPDEVEFIKIGTHSQLYEN